MNVPGKLGVRPLEATINRNTEWFGRMSPFIQFEFEGQKYRSSVCNEGGVSPSWTDTLFFDRLGGTLLHITLLDYETVKDHDFIGSAEVNVSDIFIKTEPTFRTFDLYYDGQVSAKIRFQFLFQPLISQFPMSVSGGSGGGSLMMSKKSRQNNNQPYYPNPNINYSQGNNPNNQMQPPAYNNYPSQQGGYNAPHQSFNNNIPQPNQGGNQIPKNFIGEVLAEQFGSKFKNNMQNQGNTFGTHQNNTYQNPDIKYGQSNHISQPKKTNDNNLYPSFSNQQQHQQYAKPQPIEQCALNPSSTKPVKGNPKIEQSSQKETEASSKKGSVEASTTLKRVDSKQIKNNFSAEEMDDLLR